MDFKIISFLKNYFVQFSFMLSYFIVFYFIFYQKTLGVFIMLGLVLFNFELFFKFKKRSKKDGSQISKNKKIPKKRGVKKLELPNNLEQD